MFYLRKDINKAMNLVDKKKILNYFLKAYAYLKIIALFTILWIFFSGNKDPLMIICGILAIIITFVLCIFGNLISTSSYVIKVSFFKYIYILMKDVIISTIQMTKIIYSEKLNLNPGTITMDVSNLTDQEKVLFSNLITMTPGTFVIAVEGNNFLVHALNLDDLEFKDNTKITALLKKMREKDINKPSQDTQIKEIISDTTKDGIIDTAKEAITDITNGVITKVK